MSVAFLDTERLNALVHVADHDPEFRQGARAMNGRFRFDCEAGGAVFEVRDGRLVGARLNPLLEPWDFSVSGSSQAWEKLLSPIPPPFFNHLYAAMFRQNLMFAGDLELAFAYLAPLSRLVALLRAAQNEPETAHGGV